MIDGKFSEWGQEWQNVQVLITPEPESGGTRLSLLDTEGVFLEVESEDIAAHIAQDPELTQRE